MGQERRELLSVREFREHRTRFRGVGHLVCRGRNAWGLACNDQQVHAIFMIPVPGPVRQWSMRVLLWSLLVLIAVVLAPGSAVADQPSMQEYPVPAGSHPHDVAPAVD